MNTTTRKFESFPKSWEKGQAFVKLNKATPDAIYEKINKILETPNDYYDPEYHDFRFTTLNGLLNEAIRIGINAIFTNQKTDDVIISQQADQIGEKIASKMEMKVNMLFEVIANNMIFSHETKLYSKQLLHILCNEHGLGYQDLSIQDLKAATNPNIDLIVKDEKRKLTSNIKELEKTVHDQKLAPTSAIDRAARKQ